MVWDVKCTVGQTDRQSPQCALTSFTLHKEKEKKHIGCQTIFQQAHPLSPYL
jgi:hypothetical protein